jgi:hypothetical protein
LEGGLFVDVKQAWESFARTGKVEDYIHYTRLKNQLENHVGGEVRGAGSNPGADYQGAGGGGERPAGDNPHQG